MIHRLEGNPQLQQDTGSSPYTSNCICSIQAVPICYPDWKFTDEKTEKLQSTRFDPCSPADVQDMFHFSHCAQSHLSPWPTNTAETSAPVQGCQHALAAELWSFQVLQSPKHVIFRSFKQAEIININIYSYSLISFLYSAEHGPKILPSALLTPSQKAGLLLPADFAGLCLSSPGTGRAMGWAG